MLRIAGLVICGIFTGVALGYALGYNNGFFTGLEIAPKISELEKGTIKKVMAEKEEK